MKTPHVVCAAIRLSDGLIVTGIRHYCETMCRQLERMNVLEPEAEQGFVDQFGNFLTRQEAFKLATSNGRVTEYNTWGVLYSEDLY